METTLLNRSYQSPSWLNTDREPTILRNVLLIEDNLGDVFLIKNMLLAEVEEPKLFLSHVNSLGEALQRLEKEYFDAVLLDLGLPDSHGMNTLRRLRQKVPDVPIVVLTDLDNDALAAQLIQQGAQAYLIKSHISQSWLKSTITLAMARSKHVALQHQHEQHLEQSNQVLQGQIRAYMDEIDRLKEELQTLSALASTDGLTGVANRYCFEEYFTREWLQGCRDQTPLSAIMIDLDYFKQFNDGYGHLQGDVCLRQVAQSLHRLLKRPRDIIARYGGEEFVALLPDTPMSGAVRVATSLGLEIKALAIRHPSSNISRWVTASFGVASIIPQSHTSASDFMDAADRALYFAKDNGRDRIAYYQSSKFVTQPII
ncbi:diguanylate cyclase domain-containing protein [Leptothoe spongobia]|uniref:Diguanylate cyclase n=1 Tax=Leptothoe spongobia TAU-MAC 1115 TaxID=1967444 RepID=A0A947DJL0_9CYAN|nr:diguanylate cyclase [Leptothoe spongobia]MBT9317369.1 diguanylate cyclase [Leptothoe spongobia TAU-MAC 1115]